MGLSAFPKRRESENVLMTQMDFSNFSWVQNGKLSLKFNLGDDYSD